jgi:osmotically-inducible protein OsmY
MSDKNLQQAVLDELNWEPTVDPAHIGVTANDGVVTLTGDVGSYAAKLAAQRAAGRVVGVKAVVEELRVHFPYDAPDDDDIAKSALEALAWDVEVPENSIAVMVEKGVVTLSGTVGWYYQSNAAEADVRKLRGVVDVVNNIDIEPAAQISDVGEKIKAAFKRNALIDADNIIVLADGDTVTLEGNVHSWYERGLAEDTAWSAPGVSQVNDLLTVV